MRTATLIVLGSLGPLLVACGGAGENLASLLPPPPSQATQEPTASGPLSTAPARTSGTYDTFGVAATSIAAADGTIGPTSLRALSPTDLHVTVDTAANTYTVTFDPSVFHVLDADGAIVSTQRFTITNPDGGSAVQPITNPGPPAHRENSAFYSTAGSSYVSLGEWQTDWNWSYNGQPDVMFVYGRRSAPAEIPASGTATYQSTSITGNFDAAKIALTADFGVRKIAADVFEQVCLCPETGVGGVERTRTLTGAGPIGTDGAFEVGLHGTETRESTTTQTSLIAGQLTGALFGPDASQIGGYYRLATDAPVGFIAMRPAP